MSTTIEPDSNEPNSVNQKQITVQHNGPYLVRGDVPLVRKQQVVTEYGEPIAWHKGETIDTGETYELCRCGHSGHKPFCDKTHLKIGFDGTETADTNTTAERRVIYPGGTRIVVRRDYSVCIGSGFCGNRLTTIQKMTPHTADTQVRSHVIAMIERCPSGSFTYSIESSIEGEASDNEPDNEPDLPQQIAVVTEITADGPVAGPLWVTGKIPIERSDGQAFERRNRVTLCNCGRSKIKPLCDGTHRDAQVQEAEA